MVECGPLLVNIILIAFVKLRKAKYIYMIYGKELDRSECCSLHIPFTPYITGHSDPAAHPSCAPSSPHYLLQSVRETVL